MTAPARKPAPSTTRRSIQAVYPIMTPLIEAAIPAPDAAPATARAIFQAVGFSTIQMTRIVLRGLVAEGRAVRVSAPYRSDGVIHHYRRAAGTIKGDAS